MLERHLSPDRNLEIREENKMKTLVLLQEYQKRVDLWGHGVTRKEIAELVIEQGLFTEWTCLHDIAHPLPTTSASLHKLEGWDYEARKFIILIAAPKGFDSTDFGGYESRQRSKAASQRYIFETLDQANKQKSPKNRIPPQKIIGYIDVHTFELVQNPHFSS